MALGLAVAFCTKGAGGMIAPVLFILFYLIYSGRLKELFHIHILFAFLLFAILISPVLYCYYLQFDLHPEKVIRDKSGWSGIRFILWDQLIERYEGKTFGPSRQRDFFYYFHTFLWAFAPWSIIAYVAAFHI
jgi:4-amino-4-deoxy-L-arabinose transferase-like glycosyltransferase